MQRHDPGRNRLAAFVEMLLRLSSMTGGMFPRSLPKSSHGLLPGFHVTSMSFFETGEAKRPCMKRRKFRNGYVDPIINLPHTLGEAWGVFLS